MVSHESFIILGYVYGILGTFGSFSAFLRGVTVKSSLGDHEAVMYSSMLVALLGLVYNLIFLIGIAKKNLILVKIHRIVLIIINVIAIIAIIIAILGFIGMAIFAEEKHPKTGIFIFILLIVLGLETGIFGLFLWIVNGVMAAIQESKKTSNEAVNYHYADQKCIPCTAQV